MLYIPCTISAVIKCISITLWILFERPAHLSSSPWFVLHGQLAIGGQAELHPALFPTISAPLMSWVQIMTGCQHGALRPEPSWWEVLFTDLHFQIKPLPETCVLTKTGHSNFSRNANKRGTTVTGLNCDLGFTELAGSWLWFSIYLHNCSACYSHSRSRSEWAFMLVVSLSEL